MTYTYEGVSMEVNELDGFVSWMSRWDLADSLVDRGFLRREHYGPSTYGHVSYYLAASPAN